MAEHETEPVVVVHCGCTEPIEDRKLLTCIEALAKHKSHVAQDHSLAHVLIDAQTRLTKHAVARRQLRDVARTFKLIAFDRRFRVPEVGRLPKVNRMAATAPFTQALTCTARTDAASCPCRAFNRGFFTKDGQPRPCVARFNKLVNPQWCMWYEVAFAFQLGGHTYHAWRFSWGGAETCPFRRRDDPYRGYEYGHSDYLVCNVTLNLAAHFSDLVLCHQIPEHGFFQSPGTPYHVDPHMFALLFGLSRDTVCWSAPTCTTAYYDERADDQLPLGNIVASVLPTPEGGLHIDNYAMDYKAPPTTTVLADEFVQTAVVPEGVAVCARPTNATSFIHAAVRDRERSKVCSVDA